MITVSVNHKNKSVAKNCSLQQLLKELSVQQNGIAVAINNKVIIKKNWDNTQLNQNDTITIIQATQGG